jgi:hypothetical protein
MTKFNYNEPEFKVVNMSSQDVLTASLDSVNKDWDTIQKDDAIGANDIFGL